MAATRKIRGTFCETTEAPASAFDRRSFRYKRSGAAWLLVGCPVGQYMPRAGRCKVGTRAHKIIRVASASGSCPTGSRKLRKG